MKGYITKYEKGKIEDYFNGKAAQLARRAAEVGFDKAAQEAGLKLVPTELFPVNLGNVFSFAPLRAVPDTETPTNAIYSEDFFIRAFSLGKDQVSAPDRAGRPGARAEAHGGEAASRHHGEPPGQLDLLCRQPVRPDRSRRRFS